MHPPFVFKSASGPKSCRTSSRCQKIWQCVIVLAALALALASENSWGANVCIDAFDTGSSSAFGSGPNSNSAHRLEPSFLPRPFFGANSLQQSKTWRVGDTISIQYAFSGIDRASLDKPDVRAEISSSIARETESIESRRETLVEQWESYEKAASRAGSLNPLRRWKGTSALEYQNGLSELIEINDLQQSRLAELSEVVASGQRLNAEQMRVLSSYVFSEQFKIKKKSDILSATSRLERLKLSQASFETTAQKSNSKLARGVRLLRTKWGLLGLGVLGSFAVTGYEIYSVSKSQETEESYYLIYDDQVAPK